ncbi:phosphotransferase [Frankia nepalensis]|uniref:Phosphotransferase n=1 Tax=Frankia nepalensis TaxID=1836974 RepID=A0A937US56_9ACTN|nr:phosphotransferase [Frankia nepalensis]MBL7628531.1 phosphotransferase [Frankia nepalensis]
MTAHAGFVHQLLGFLEQRGWEGAPRFLGVDEHGREILGFLPGHVGWEPEQPPAVLCDESLVQVAELVRQLHDLTAGTPLAGGSEVVCHNDLAPRNTVYRDLGDGLRPVAFLDWDLASPGARIQDVAHVCWQFLHLGPAVTDLDETRRRIRLICAAYGLRQRAGVVETILWCQDCCWRGVQAGVLAGEPTALRLRDAGVIDDVRAGRQWVAENRRQLEARGRTMQD